MRRPTCGSLSILSITSNGSCVDVYPVVTRCTLPATLTVSLSGPIVVPQYRFFLILDSGDSDSAAALISNPSDPTNSSVRATVLLDGYALSQMGRPVSVYLYDTQTANRSVALSGGVSVAPVPVPSLASISGCQGGGAATSGCVPTVDTLAFTGSGFLTFNMLSDVELVVGTSSGYLYADRSGSGVQVVNDSYITLSLDTAYELVVQAVHYSGASLPIKFNLRYYSYVQRRLLPFYTNALSISFAPLPPPIVTTILAPKAISPGNEGGCSPEVLVAPFSGSGFMGCLGGLNYLFFSGHYLYLTSVTLSRADTATTWPCAVPYFSGYAATLSVCYLPWIPTDVPGQAWDVQLTTPAGSQLISRLVSFVTTPALTGLGRCTASAESLRENLPWLSPLCAPGAVLTLRGSSFVSDPAVTVLLGIPSTTAAVVCPQATRVSSTIITCVVPALNATFAAAMYGRPNSVQVRFPSANSSTNTLQGGIVAYPDSPVLTAISGCSASNGSLGLSECRPGDLLTVTGTNLNVSWPGDVSIYWFDSTVNGYIYCTPLPGGSATAVSCQLPFITPDTSSVQEGQWLIFGWHAAVRATGGIYVGNTFAISWTWTAAPSGSSSSSAGNAAAIVASVLVPVLVLAAAVVAWAVWKRMAAHKNQGGAGMGSEVDMSHSSASQWSGGWSRHSDA